LLCVFAGAVAAVAFAVPATTPQASAETSARSNGPHWVGVWAASPTDAASQSLADRTVRTIITPLGSGRRLRIRLSNEFGDQPITIDAASIAEQSVGAAVSAETIQRVKFDGRRVVKIPAGKRVMSDPVRIRFRALQPLAVSTDVDAASTGSVTEHASGRQTSYLSSPGTGSHALDSSGSAFGATTTARFLLTGVEARANRSVGAVAVFGDSITDGYEGSGSPLIENLEGVDMDGRYPDFLARRLVARRGPQQLTVLNAGISGNRILEDGLVPSFGPSGLSRLGRDAIQLRGVETVIVLEGINDIGQSSASAPEVIGGLKQGVKRLKRAGLRVFLGTLTPAAGTILPSYGDAEPNAVRIAVNDWIRGQRLATGVIDFDDALRDPGDPSRLAPVFDSSDHLHPSKAGYKAMAGAVPLGRLIGCC
jgi:lysophospholipase L1-like esterase